MAKSNSTSSTNTRSTSNARNSSNYSDSRNTSNYSDSRNASNYSDSTNEARNYTSKSAYNANDCKDSASDRTQTSNVKDKETSKASSKSSNKY